MAQSNGAVVDWRASTPPRRDISSDVPGFTTYTETVAKDGSSISAIIGRRLDFRLTKSIEDPYLQDGYVHAALRARSQAMVQMRLRLWDKDPRIDDTAKPIDDHQLAILLERPNPMQTMSQFLEAGLLNRAIDGIDYWMLLGADQKPIARPGEIPSYMLSVAGSCVAYRTNDLGWPVEYRISHVGGTQQVVLPHVMIPFRDCNPKDPFAGAPVVQVAQPEIDLNWQAFRLNRALIEHSGDPGGHWEGAGELAPEEKAVFENEIKERDKVYNAGSKRVGPRGAKYVPHKNSPRDMQMMEMLRFNRDKILSILGVPGPIVGVLDRAILNNFQQCEELFWKGGNGILAYGRSVEDVATNHFLRMLSDARARNYFLRFDTSQVEALREDENVKLELAAKLVQSGLCAPNEACKLVGVELEEFALKYGDVQLVSSTLKPIEQVIAGDTDEEDDPEEEDADGDDEPDPDDDPPAGDEPEPEDDKGASPRTRAVDDDEPTLGAGQTSNLPPLDVDSLMVDRLEWVERLDRSVRDDIRRIFVLALEDMGGELESMGVDFDVVQPNDGRVLTALNEQVIRLANDHTQVLAERVRGALLDGLSEATNTGNLQQMVAEVLPEIEGSLAEVFSDKQVRAQTIALTETAKAANGARFMQMREAEVDASEWITSRDTAVRGNPDGPYADAQYSHFHLDGVTAEIGKDFVDKEGTTHAGLKFPGDPDAAPGDVIRCRCLSRAKRDGSTEEDRAAYWHTKEASYLRFARKKLAAHYKTFRQKYEKAQIEKVRQFAGVSNAAA